MLNGLLTLSVLLRLFLHVVTVDRVNVKTNFVATFFCTTKLGLLDFFVSPTSVLECVNGSNFFLLGCC